MSTSTMNISVTEDIKSFVDTRIAAKGFSSVSEYMRDLVRRDIERAAEERFVALIEEGLQSGIDPRPWSEIRQSWLNKIAKSKGKPLSETRSRKASRERLAA